MKLSSIIYKFLILFHELNPFKKIFCQILKFLNIPNNKFFNDINFNGKFKVNLKTNFFYLFHFGDTISKHTYWKGLFKTYENDTGWIWMELCKVSNNIFDIGSNTGIYSLVAKTINNQSKVYAFEPSERTFSHLKKNNQINNYNIQCEKIALSNKSENQIFYDVPHENQTSASLSPNKLKNFKNFNGDIIEYYVKTMRVDDFIKKNKIKAIDLVKIDVELHDADVIEGFGGFLEKLKPIVIIEVLIDEVANKLNHLVPVKEYFIFNLTGETRAKKVEKFNANHLTPNYIFFHNSLLNKVKKSTSLYENLS